MFLMLGLCVGKSRCVRFHSVQRIIWSLLPRSYGRLTKEKKKKKKGSLIMKQ
jgi:hypothetical protein